MNQSDHAILCSSCGNRAVAVTLTSECHQWLILPNGWASNTVGSCTTASDDSTLEVCCPSCLRSIACPNPTGKQCPL